ncbi:MAG: 2-hydroxycyclohexanecarboxyl-CoA dehydrogenase [Gaiellales bacterium]|nr:2-hydroxycyclohexanecarboxyl-CoA dehydrogenase [Gaiellales bacterium]
MNEPPVALVTGAAGGIGAATAAALEQRGYVVARNHLPGDEVPGYSAPADVSDAGAVHAMVDRAEAEVGPVDVLVNCAGYAQEIPLEEITDADWRRMLGVHLGGTFHTCRLLGPRMRDRGGGSIVNVSSELALTGSDVMPHYCAAKGAIIGLTRALALELAPQVRVNSVAPGPTDTPLLTDLWRGDDYLQTLPVRRLSTPQEIGEAVAFLATAEGSFFTGQVLSPNAGTVI